MNIDLPRLIDACAGLKITVVGDAILDVYLEGGIGRLCREAPLPVVDVTERKCITGGAANTAVNVHEMGGCVMFHSVVGNDWAGDRLRQTLRERGIASAGLIVEVGRRTLVKHRLIGGEQMLARFDEGFTSPISADTERRLSETLQPFFDRCGCSHRIGLWIRCPHAALDPPAWVAAKKDPARVGD